MHQCFLSRSRFTPLMSMESGLSVTGDCQCFYTGLNLVRKITRSNSRTNDGVHKFALVKSGERERFLLFTRGVASPDCPGGQSW